MNKILALLIAACLPMTATHAADSPRPYAQVISSRPVYGEVRVAERHRECAPPDEAVAEDVAACRTVTAWRLEQRVEGYDVLYHYDGRTYNTRLPYDPGERLPVRDRSRGAAMRLQ
ncbi:hypothetical protein D0B54_12900 [Solimonas sp. K1W22B-7]|uniref:hypothetical protein n=1 Tax=Solimonas sp. K1W22B-7 TaxID=2303331 RepID=UPI000E332261|nr:hypothetical protein [Solimonas sp. K1W22B-7]AXQ29534.1 hypothetical protein D0B54_12900 [Solimonas sp. K1W22B-7]